MGEESYGALKVVGRILACSSSEHIDHFIYCDGLDALSCLLTDNGDVQMTKETLWSLSNITAGSEGQIQKFLEHPTILTKVFELMNSDSVGLRRESTYVITNFITTSERPEDHLLLCEFNDRELINLLTTNLKLDDANIVIEIIQALDVLMELDKDCCAPLTGEDSIAYRFEAAGGPYQLGILEKHPNIKVFNEI